MIIHHNSVKSIKANGSTTLHHGQSSGWIRKPSSRYWNPDLAVKERKPTAHSVILCGGCFYSFSVKMNGSHIGSFTCSVRVQSDVFLSASSCGTKSPRCCPMSFFKATFICFPAGSVTHSHKLQKWCSRREWLVTRWGWCLCRNQWRLRSCGEKENNDL